MSKIKKVLALVLAMAMVMAMSIVSFAATSTESPYNATITITNLKPGTIVNVYRAIYLDTEEDEWIGWGTSIVNPLHGGALTTEEASALGAAAGSKTPDNTITVASDATSLTYTDVVGTYVFLAASDKEAYNVMAVSTYKADETYMTAEDKKIIAKSAGEYTTTKEADEGDNFVAKGQEIQFTVTTNYPNFPVADSDDNSYKIVDEPTGLTITSVESVSIGGQSISPVPQFTVNNGKYTLDLTSTIGTTNANAGKTVVVVYKATVDTDEGYSNTVNAYRNETKLGDGDSEEGFTGSIELTKYASNSTTGLKGAKFIVYMQLEDQTFKYATFDVNNEFAGWETDSTKATEVETDVNGIVKVTGLDEGTYILEETVAPDGYSLNTGNDGKKTVTITANENGGNVDLTKDTNPNDLIMYNTKLSALPSTGGIGTTIFTVVGCLIMIAAAAMFFVSRRRTEK